MDLMRAAMEQKEAIKAMDGIEVYSKEWWEKIPSTITFVPPELRPMMVFAVVFSSVQM